MSISGTNKACRADRAPALTTAERVAQHSGHSCTQPPTHDWVPGQSWCKNAQQAFRVTWHAARSAWLKVSIVNCAEFTTNRSHTFRWRHPFWGEPIKLGGFKKTSPGNGWEAPSHKPKIIWSKTDKLAEDTNPFSAL